jgi:hypothetical protein
MPNVTATNDASLFWWKRALQTLFVVEVFLMLALTSMAAYRLKVPVTTFLPVSTCC